MAKIKFGSDISKYEDFGPLNEGDYIFQVKEVKTGRTKTDKPKLEILLVVAEGERKGFKLTEQFSFTDNAGKKNLHRLLVAAGLAEEGKPVEEFDTDALVGKRVLGKVEHQKGEDKKGKEKTFSHIALGEFHKIDAAGGGEKKEDPDDKMFSS